MLLHAHEEFRFARDAYVHAASLASSGRWAYLLGLAEQELGDASAAANAFQRTNYPQAILALGHLLLEQGRSAEAEVVFRRADNSPHALYGLGQALSDRQDDSSAIKTWERAVERAPDYASAWYALAQAYRRAGQVDLASRAIAAYQRTRSLGWTPADPLLDEVRALYSGLAGRIASGTAAARTGDFEAARREFEAAIEADPRSTTAHSNLISLFTEMGRFKEARKHYEAALAINPNWADAHIAWAAALALQSQVDDAVRALEQAREINPYGADARVRLGLLYQNQNKLDLALAEFQAAVQHSPLHPRANQLLGECLVAAGQLEQGLERLSRSLPDDDSAPAIYEALANRHETNGNHEASEWYLRRGAELARRHGQGHLADRLERRLQ